VSFRKTIYLLTLVALLALPVVLLFLPANYFDEGESLCPSKRFFDTECPGCGMTRGVMHTIHFQFKKAWEFNKLTFLVLPILIYLWGKMVLDFWRKVF
jgi:Protein of unknown function (DUF2752)